VPHSITELCQAAHERCEQAKAVTGDERRLYLHDALAKLASALDVFAREISQAKILPFPERQKAK